MKPAPTRVLDDEHKQWYRRVSELCYKKFELDPEGKLLLELLEKRFFNRMIADPNHHPNLAYHNDGFNHCLRYLRTAINSYVNQQKKR